VEVIVSCQLPESGNTLLASFRDEAGAAWFTWDHELAAPAPNTQAAVTFSQAWTRGEALTLSVEGAAPSDALDAFSQVDMLRGGQRFSASSLGDGSLLAGGVAYAVVPDFADEVESSVWYSERATGSAPRLSVIARRGPTSAASVAFDVSEFLDVPQGISVEQGSDPLRPTLSFNGPLTPSGVDALVTSVTLSWSEGDTATSLTWRGLVPADATTFTLPALPQSFISDVVPDVQFGIASVGDDLADDFDGYRARPFRVAYGQEYDVPVRIDATDCAEHKLTAWIASNGI
jgi:hypothetical protein